MMEADALVIGQARRVMTDDVTLVTNGTSSNPSSPLANWLKAPVATLHTSSRSTRRHCSKRKPPDVW